jgi:hypothetical protein
MSPTRYARAHHRHDLHTLTYVTLDEANGGIVRNVNHQGMAVQAVGALRPKQNVRVSFELRHPRLQVEANGEVVWATPSGQCGIRFLDLPPRLTHQINEWIFGNLLETAPQHSMPPGSMFATSWFTPASPEQETACESDGLIVSHASRKVIQLQPADEALLQPAPLCPAPHHPTDDTGSAAAPLELDWLSQPLSGRTLALTVDVLMVIASLLLFSLVFLSIAHELPQWPLNLETAFGAALFVVAFYWGFFHAFGGASLGARLARMAESNLKGENESGDADRFR